MKDYYKILNLKSNATLRQIRDSYKKHVKELKQSANLNLESQKKLSEVLQAYEVLKNPLTKRKYDAILKNESSSSKRIKKSHSERDLIRYNNVVSKKIHKGSLKNEKVIRKSENRIRKDFNIGDILFNFGELLEFILNLISAFVK